MVSLKCVSRSVMAIVLLSAATARAQEMPADYQAVLSALGKTGDFKDGVLKVNIPRNDLRVTISQRPAPTPFGFGGWVALKKTTATLAHGQRPRSVQPSVITPPAIT